MMNNLKAKKLFVLGLGLVGITSLVGCGAKEIDGSSEEVCEVYEEVEHDYDYSLVIEKNDKFLIYEFDDLYTGTDYVYELYRRMYYYYNEKGSYFPVNDSVIFGDDGSDNTMSSHDEAYSYALTVSGGRENIFCMDYPEHNLAGSTYHK